jgi:hypothetical protein
MPFRRQIYRPHLRRQRRRPAARQAGDAWGRPARLEHLQRGPRRRASRAQMADEPAAAGLTGELGRGATLAFFYPRLNEKRPMVTRASISLFQLLKPLPRYFQGLKQEGQNFHSAILASGRRTASQQPDTGSLSHRISFLLSEDIAREGRPHTREGSLMRDLPLMSSFRCSLRE